MSCPKPRRNAVVIRSTAAFARHDLAGASCGCRGGEVGAIRRFKLGDVPAGVETLKKGGVAEVVSEIRTSC